MALIPKVKLPRVALQRSTLQTPNTPKFVKPKDGKRYVSMLGVFLTLLDKWGRPQPDKLSIHSRRPLGVHLLPWLYHGNSYWRDRANQNLPKVQERTLRHRSNEHCRAVWRPHWPFMQKHLVRPQFRDRFSKSAFRPKDYDVSLFALFESVCACKVACASTASMFASNQTACQRKKTSDDENLCSSPVKPTTTPHTRLARALRSSLKITSASFARRFVLDGHGEAGICSNNG